MIVETNGKVGSVGVVDRTFVAALLTVKVFDDIVKPLDELFQGFFGVLSLGIEAQILTKCRTRVGDVAIYIAFAFAGTRIVGGGPGDVVGDRQRPILLIQIPETI